MTKSANIAADDLEPVRWSDFGGGAVRAAGYAHRILTSMLAELEALGDIAERLIGVEPPNDYLKRLVRRGVPYEPAEWFDGPWHAARRMACCRALARLARDGLVERVTESKRDRTTHLRFTRRGLKRAIPLAGPNVQPDVIVVGLLATDWGGGLVDAVPLTAAQRRRVERRLDRMFTPPDEK